MCSPPSWGASSTGWRCRNRRKRGASAPRSACRKSLFDRLPNFLKLQKSFKKLFDPTRKGTLTVHLRAKCRRFAAVALRNALRGSLSHYPSLRILQQEGLSTISRPASVRGACSFGACFTYSRGASTRRMERNSRRGQAWARHSSSVTGWLLNRVSRKSRFTSRMVGSR